MNDAQLKAYGHAEFAKLESAYGKDLDARLQSAAKLIDTLEATRPGLKQVLKTHGIGDNALVVSALIQQAERFEIRHKRSRTHTKPNS
jgi:predicted phage tail protein